MQYTHGETMARNKQDTRKRIMDAAYVLFRKRGYTRVNVDEIAATAGITKRTLYSHFESKDALLENVLEDQQDMALKAFRTFGKQLIGTPEEIVRIFFKELAQWSKNPKWSASGFTRLAMELADLPGHPARRIASRHKKLLESHLADALYAVGLKNAESSAKKIWIISEGAMALVLIHGDVSYYEEALNVALRVISD
jgi:AcrR family transcriptional regulator